MVKHIFRGLAILPILVLLVMLAPAPALAADLRGGDSVIVASGDVIDDDLYLAAGRIIINGTVNGDVLCVGETINVNGKINGSIVALGSTIGIDGEVTHAVRVAGANINIGGRIGGDLVVAGDDVNLTSSAKIGRDLVFAASSTNINTLISRSIKGYGGEVNLNDGVGGNAEIGAEHLTIASTANIQGNLVYVSKNEAIIQSGARIGGITTHKMPETRKPVFPGMGVWGRVILFLMTLVTGSLIILIAPKRATAVAASIKRKPLLSLGWGAIILFATPIAAVITFVTVIGIPVGLIGLVLYGVGVYLSQVAVGLFLGYWIIGSFSKVDSRGVLLGAFALGFSILTLLNLIPYVGFPLWVATALFGIGAMALSQKTLRTGASAEVPEITTK